MPNRSDVTLEEREMPSELAEQFQVSLGLDRPPATLVEWADATAELLDNQHVPDRLEMLCLTANSRHEARIDGEIRHFRCFFDTLLVPFVADGTPEVRVRSRSPVSDAVVTGEVTDEAVSVEPKDAVMSFGAATDVVSADYLEVPATLAYRRFCPYINIFVDEAEYGRWEDADDSGVTMPLSVPEGFALARRLVATASEEG